MLSFFGAPYFMLFFIIALGFLIGNIKIKGISLDVSAVLFVALFLGYLGFKLPHEFQTLGLILFMYTVGMQAAPGFFESFKKHGRQLFLVSLILISSATIIAVLIKYFSGLDKNMVVGLFTGALTSTPGLAAAIDSTNSPLTSIGYGIAYPFGVIGVIVFVKLLPKILKTDIKTAESDVEKQILENHPEIYPRTFILQNPNASGKTIGELKIRRITGAVISRVAHNNNIFTPSPSTVLYLGDKLHMVGPKKALQNVESIIGPAIDEELPLSNKYQVQWLLVTNKEVFGKTLRQINLSRIYSATVTRVRRSGIDLTPDPGLQLQMGDKIVVACSIENMKHVAVLFGNNDKKLSDTDFFPIAVGILLGILLGKLSISFGASFNLSIGLTGGVLFAALILGRIGRTGPLVWSMSGAATNLLKQLGLLFFLATVGTEAGSTIVDTFSNYGFSLFIWGAVITVLPMIITVFICNYIFKMNILNVLGALTGGMTSTPGLAAVESMTASEAPKIAYATIYPIAMVLLIIFLQFVLL